VTTFKDPTRRSVIPRPRRDRATRGTRRLRLLAVEVGTPIAVLAALIVWTEHADIYYYPPLADILTDFPQVWFVDRLHSDVLPSLTRMGLGFGLATAIAVPLGLLLGQSHRVRATLGPLLEFLRAIPAPALIPLAILLIGIGDTAKIVLIAAVCIWPIFLNAMDGAAGIEPMLRRTATVFGITRWDRQLRVVLPGALPQIFAGMRVAIALALIMVVISEMAASQNGIGYVILLAQRTFQLSTMWSGIILLGLLGFLLNFLFTRLERHVLAWHHSSWRTAEQRDEP
jgi:ABC-type nitrate/sulfonate/bicarbonate transport system permease component